VVLIAVASTGCTAALRTSDGGAFTKPTAGGAQINSVYIGDRGGLFTRLGIATLGMAAAVGTVENVQSSSSDSGVYDSSGNRIGTERTDTTSGSINTQRAQEGQRAGDQMIGAADAQLKGGAVSQTDNYEVVTGGLEIASTRLGGDTSGWMFDFGGKVGKRRGSFGIRAAIKMGFGKYTFQPRMRDEVMLAESTYTFIGFPLRLGVTYRGIVEIYGQLDINLVTTFNELIPDENNSSPSPWRTGARLSVAKYFYAEAALLFSAMRQEKTSALLEVGLEF
jgi:hypothetical protein